MLQASDEAQIRANLFQVYASFFLKVPSQEFLTEAAANPIIDLEIDEEWDLQTLEEEFHALFRVPAGRYVYPYESCYLGREKGRPGRLLGKPAMEVQQCYAGAGLAVDSGTEELPDHAGLESHFLYLLASEESEALTQNNSREAEHWRQMQRRFLSEHVNLWFPDLCDEIDSMTQHPYLCGMARWIQTTLAEIGEALDEGL